jgi:drug/metabolite transporter (DMT)-like permease
VPPEAAAAALLSALIHASWNALVKSGADRMANLFLIGAGSVVIAVLLLPFAGPPPWHVWHFLLLSACIHGAYWWALLRGYALGDLSHVYTLSRGLAPLLVGIGAAITASEFPAPLEAAGMALICAGVLSVGFSPGATWKATKHSLLLAAIIAAYSLNDALGARASGDPVRYIVWMTLGFAVPQAVFSLLWRGPAKMVRAVRTIWPTGLAAGALSAGGFGIVIWAQSRAPIAQVTALRETSVVIAALIAWIFLKERLGPRRWAGAVLVVLGALLIGFY